MSSFYEYSGFTEGKRHIVHMDLDTFFVSVERLLNSSLKGIPVLIGGISDRGVVASCSYEARRFGVSSGMSMKLARRMCPDAAVIRGDSGTYSKYSNLITDIIKENAPLYEKSSIDEFYIDVSGMDRFFGCYKWARELRQRIIRESGLPISMGLSTSKTVSKIGTGEAKPNGHIQVREGTEKPFLSPLAVDKIPMAGEKTCQLLRSMGVVLVRTVQEMPPEMMERVLGKNGLMLWKKANGIDNAPVISYYERKSISIERTFDKDTIDVVKLKNILTGMAESLAFQLRNGNKLSSCVTVKIRYADFNTYSRQMRIPYTACDHILINYVKEIFNLLYDRRQLVRLIGVRMSHLVEGGYQINLFEDTAEMISLYQAMDRMRNRFGLKAITRASCMHVRTMNGGNPFNGQPPIIPAHRKA